MAYKKGEIIKANDLGKVITNGDAEMANYKILAVTVGAVTGSNTYYSTFLFNVNSSAT